MLINKQVQKTSIPQTTKNKSKINNVITFAAGNTGTNNAKVPVELFNSYFVANPKILTISPRTVLPFKALTRKELFDKLSTEEKSKLLEAVKVSMASEPNVFLTLINKKPSAYSALDKKCVSTLEKYRYLLESNTFKFVFEPLDKTTNKNYRRFFLINVPELSKVVDNNLAYFRMRLNNSNLDTKGVIKKLLGKDSPLLDLQNFHDLIGITLGFPLQDNFMFRAASDISNMIAVLKDKGKGDSIQARTLKAMYSIVRPDLKMYDSDFPEKMPEVLKLLNLTKPKISFPKTHFYRFVTWDHKSPEMQELTRKINTSTPEVKRLFKQPEDLINCLLDA